MQKTERNGEIEMNGEEMSDMVEKLKAIDLSVSDEFDKFKYNMMLKSRFDIFNSALSIAFYSAIMGYFRTEDDLLEVLEDDTIANLYNHRGTIISMLWDKYLTVDFLRFDTSDGLAELVSMSF